MPPYGIAKLHIMSKANPLLEKTYSFSIRIVNGYEFLVGD
jgi:hypothetical protein